MMRLRRNASTLAVATALMLSATGCGGDAEPTAGPTETTTSATPPESTSPTEPAWEDKYTKRQLDGYEAALSRWETYESRSEPIWASGVATDRAEAFFKQYLPSPSWQAQFRLLQSYEQGDVTRRGTADVYWSKAKSISMNGLNVEIEQCVDYRPIVTEQNGREAQRPKWALQPNLRTITLSKPKGYDWLIYRIVDASSGKSRPCEP